MTTTLGLQSVLRPLLRAVKSVTWALGNSPICAEERFALALAARHISEGRLDLAEEDLAWLGRWIEQHPTPPSLSQAIQRLVTLSSNQISTPTRSTP